MSDHSYPSTTEKYIKPNEKKQHEALTQLHRSIFISE